MRRAKWVATAAAVFARWVFAQRRHIALARGLDRMSTRHAARGKAAVLRAWGGQMRVCAAGARAGEAAARRVRVMVKSRVFDQWQGRRARAGLVAVRSERAVERWQPATLASTFQTWKRVAFYFRAPAIAVMLARQARVRRSTLAFQVRRSAQPRKNVGALTRFWPWL